MAFIDHNVAQLTVDYARIKMKYKGDAFDYQGNPATTIPVDANGEQGAPVPLDGNGGQGGFTAWLPTGFMVMPINDRFAFGLSQVVPMGMRSTWDQNGSKLRDFAVDTKIETVGLTGSLSYKVRDDFSWGGGHRPAKPGIRQPEPQPDGCCSGFAKSWRSSLSIRSGIEPDARQGG